MLFAIIAVVLGGAALYFLLDYLIGLFERQVEQVEKKEAKEPEEIVCELDPVVEPVAEGDLQAEPLIVKHLDEGRSTVLIRRRERRGVITGQLLIWSGVKRKKIQDSLYDLGVIKAAVVTEEVIQRFIADAMNVLHDLKTVGRRKKQQRGQEAEEVVSVPVVTEEQPVVASEESIKPTHSFPDVYRGVITSIGYSPKDIGDRTIEAFGITYMTDSGDKLDLTGSHLRTALQEAGATEGDKVEIVKVGKKLMGKGKSPMQLFRVAKVG